MMIRSILPVGQGAFYLEKFMFTNKSINVIYDCGTSTNKVILESEIKYSLNKSEIIHAVFISHFHEDHINGLEYLLKNYKIENIFIPLITNNEYKKMLIFAHTHFIGKVKSSFFVSFLNDPLLAIREICDENQVPQLFQVKQFSANDDNNREYNDSILILPNKDGSNNDDNTNKYSNPQLISSNQNVSEFICSNLVAIWKYIPANFCDESRIECFYKKVATVLKCYRKEVNCDSITSAMKKDPEFIKCVKNCYRQMGENLNAHSMTLLSVSCDEEITQRLMSNYSYICYLPRSKYCFHALPSGCLYTGDINLHNNWEEISVSYSHYLDKIGCLQVPHHGSTKNCNRKIAEIPNCLYYFISSGYNNKYRHPHQDVINNLLFNRKLPLIVTEKPGSAVKFIVSLRRHF